MTSFSHRYPLERMLGIDRCGSPLEIALAQAFARQSSFVWRDADDHPWVVGRWPRWFLTLFAQPDYGPYWPDFAITGEAPRHPSLPPLENEAFVPKFMVIVEVDGHDHHDLTKDQAEHDRRRDRYMTETNARLFRFTGREIHRNPDACANQVLAHVIGLQQPNLDAAFGLWLQQTANSQGGEPPQLDNSVSDDD